ncbi:hypothetical protein Dda_2660 [Drechslerella dactyloides]|uniref:Uncharacterized protein n=1 Tax=Drechslerella dactyloides TaxID=74499 RepID=A0AAD6J0F1_DREDA|nr:hypothetical protein Dda_2660 [Drechslerella dactyloides]
MCVEAVAGAEVNVILDIRDSPRPFLSVQTPYLFVKFTHPAERHFNFEVSATSSSSSSGLQMPRCTALSNPPSNRKRCRPPSEDEGDPERPEKRRRLRLQIAFSTLSSPYAYPPAKKGSPSRPTVLGQPGFQVIGRDKLPKVSGDLIRKTAILNRIRRDSMARDQELNKSAEEKKQDILRRHRMQFEGYRADPLHNPPPSAEILEERWDADDMPRYEDEQPDECEEIPWQFLIQ